MENEQPTSYEVPTNIEFMSPEEAGTALNKIFADAGGNVSHPYCNNIHPQSKAFKAAVEQMYAIKRPESLKQTNKKGEVLIDSCQFPQAVVDAMAEALDEKAGRDEAVQEKLRKDMREEIKKVNELMPGSDIDIDEAIEDATPEKLEGYKMMRLLGQGDYASLMPLIVKDARALGMPLKQVEQLQFFLSDAVPGDPLSEDITNIIIRHIHKAKKLRANRED